MKCIVFTLCAVALIFYSMSSYAQKELWAGVNPAISTTPPFYPNAAYPNGAIVKTDSIGNILSFVHIFDTLNGRFCSSQLLQASNGKLYGTTSLGGSANNGTLFVYDPVIDSYRVLVNFGTASFPYMTPFGGLIEGLPGVLYGPCSYGQGIYTYDIAADTIHLSVALPSFPYGLGTYQTTLKGQLFKASDGYIYGTTNEYSACPSSAPALGAVIKINPATNIFSYAYPFNCTMADGAQPNGGFVELGGKLYSNTMSGGIYGTSGHGVIFAYDLAAHTYTKKMDFSDTTGVQPIASFIKATNNKFYGYIPLGFDATNTYSYTMYEYDPLTNVYSRKHGFNYATAVGRAPLNKPLQASNGKLYGATEVGVFEYDISADTIRHAATLNDCSWQQFTELCRKPAYRYYSNAYDTICHGGAFSFDLHCNNAQTFSWSHDGIIDPTHTTAVLSFPTAATSDSGTWVCTLTNVCGSTIAPPIHIVIAPLPVAGSILGPDTLCVTSAITLSDTVSGGTWSVTSFSVATISSGGVLTGISAGDVTVIYSVTNSCGAAYDTAMITVSAPIASAGVITGPSAVCAGDTIILTDTTAGGTWGAVNGRVSVSAGIVAGINAGADTVYYTISGFCGAAVATMVVTVYALPVAGSITGIDSICIGDTTLLADTVTGGVWTSSNNLIATISAGGVLTAVAEGNAVITYTVTDFCGSADAIHQIYVRSEAECNTGIAVTTISQGLDLYPNPNTGAFTLMFHSAVNETVHIIISDLAGRVVKELTLTSNTITPFFLDRPAGIYQLSARAAGARYLLKLVLL